MESIQKHDLQPFKPPSLSHEDMMKFWEENGIEYAPKQGLILMPLSKELPEHMNPEE